jgi:hypothetical protein
MTTHRCSSSLITDIVSLSCMTTLAGYMNILHETQMLYPLPFYSLIYTFLLTTTSTNIMTTNVNLLATAGVPAFLCPQGTRVHLLNLGTMRVDAGW